MRSCTAPTKAPTLTTGTIRSVRLLRVLCSLCYQRYASWNLILVLWLIVTDLMQSNSSTTSNNLSICCPPSLAERYSEEHHPEQASVPVGLKRSTNEAQLLPLISTVCSSVVVSGACGIWSCEITVYCSLVSTPGASAVPVSGPPAPNPSTRLLTIWLPQRRRSALCAPTQELSYL